MISEAGEQAQAGSYLQYEIVNNELTVCSMLDGAQTTDWAIYDKN